MAPSLSPSPASSIPAVLSVNIFVYQRGKATGPFTAEGLRQRLLSGELKPTHLVWHSRLTEWVPLGALASTPHREEECIDMPAPQASQHYTPGSSGGSSAPERPRQRVRRSRSEENGGASTSASSRSESASKPDSERRKSRSGSGGRERSSSTQGEVTTPSLGDSVRKRRAKKEPKEASKQAASTSNFSLWKLVKEFFRH